MDCSSQVPACFGILRHCCINGHIGEERCIVVDVFHVDVHLGACCVLPVRHPHYQPPTSTSSRRIPVQRLRQMESEKKQI